MVKVTPLVHRLRHLQTSWSNVLKRTRNQLYFQGSVFLLQGSKVRLWVSRSFLVLISSFLTLDSSCSSWETLDSDRATFSSSFSIAALSLDDSPFSYSNSSFKTLSFYPQSPVVIDNSRPVDRRSSRKLIRTLLDGVKQVRQAAIILFSKKLLFHMPGEIPLEGTQEIIILNSLRRSWLTSCRSRNYRD